MEQSKMNYRSIALSVIVSVFIGIIGFSFAYFTVGVTGSGGGAQRQLRLRIYLMLN